MGDIYQIYERGESEELFSVWENGRGRGTNNNYVGDIFEGYLLQARTEKKKQMQEAMQFKS